ncbi:hypothetical protein HS088_TW15G00028 [Tripterygium wilfordii]|uniref:UDP-N-acetylglucosamine--N-acetylmuramyl-(Pentapeptide) pyrophosphoryl-undecaprenol N-acetylglucosamine transferase n=1 Tax=Tripterygium wilfordii TaxID=458696 RepID=A0A7J7CKN0_TRIWF|nr:hypothetical protein HS088_TW15G00028 [Tripterygium wilfordii]
MGFTISYSLKYCPSSFRSFSNKPRSVEIFCCLSLEQSNHKITTKPTSINGGDSESNSLRVVFAAGGTGGHISPAVAIADELKFIEPTTQILFMGTRNSMESAAVPSAGYNFLPVPAVKLFRPFFSPRNLLLPYNLIVSTLQCYRELQDFDPHIVVGTGGYVSFSICLAAAIKGAKVVIQEQNSVPGIANWVLSFFADMVFVAFNSTVDSFWGRHKCVVCGNPVRLSLRKYISKAVARLKFFPNSVRDEEAKVILVLGGSLGANAVNIALLNLYYQMLLDHQNWFIIWQTGVQAYDEMESLVKIRPRLLLKPFFHSMDSAYAAADLIVSRAGAMTCSEILATGKPAILIPSADVAEGHQVRNATLMADVAGSRVIFEDELDSTTLGTAIEEILSMLNPLPFDSLLFSECTFLSSKRSLIVYVKYLCINFHLTFAL